MENKLNKNTMKKENAVKKETEKAHIKREYVEVSKNIIKKVYTGVNNDTGKGYESILIKVSNDFEFGLDTRFVFADVYTNYVTISIAPTLTYQNALKNNEPDALKAVEGAAIIKHLKSIKE